MYVAGALLAKGSRLLLIPLYVRLLSTSEVGIIVFVEAVSFGLTRLFSFSLGQAVKRFYIEYEDEADADQFVAGLWWVGAGLATLGASATGLVAWLWGDLLTQQVLPYYLMLAVVSGLLQSNFNIPLQRFIVRQDPVRNTALTVLPLVTSALLILYLITQRGMGVDGVLWGQILSMGLWNVGLAVAMRQPSFPVAEIRAAFRYALPILPHALFAWALTFSDRIVLERFVSLEQLGIYGIGYQLGSVLTIISLGIINAWLPRFFRAAAAGSGPEEFRRTFSRVMLLIAYLAAGLIVLAPEVVRIVATERYEGAVVILRIVTLGFILHGSYQALLLPLFYSKDSGRVSVVTGVAFILNLGLILLLVSRFGILGAAWSTVVAYVAATGVAIGQVRAVSPIRYDTSALLRGALLLAGMVVALWWIQFESLWMNVAAKGLFLAGLPALAAAVPGLLPDAERRGLVAWLNGLVRRPGFRADIPISESDYVSQ